MRKKSALNELIVESPADGKALETRLKSMIDGKRRSEPRISFYKNLPFERKNQRERTFNPVNLIFQKSKFHIVEPLGNGVQKLSPSKLKDLSPGFKPKKSPYKFDKKTILLLDEETSSNVNEEKSSLIIDSEINKSKLTIQKNMLISSKSYNHIPMENAFGLRKDQVNNENNGSQEVKFKVQNGSSDQKRKEMKAKSYMNPQNNTNKSQISPVMEKKEQTPFLNPIALIKDKSKVESGYFFNEKFNDYYNDRLSEIINTDQKFSRSTSKNMSIYSQNSSRSPGKFNNLENLDQLYLLEQATGNHYSHKILDYYLNSEKELEDLEKDDSENIIHKIHEQLIVKDLSDSYFLEVEEKYSIRSIKGKYISEFNSGTFKTWTLWLLYYCRIVRLSSRTIVNSTVFQLLTIIIVLLNNFLLGAHLRGDLNPSFYEKTEAIFLLFYFIEMIFKIIGWGLYNEATSYLNNPWNLLDFSVLVLTFFYRFLYKELSLNLTPARLISLLSMIKLSSLNTVIKSLFLSLRLLIESFVSLFYIGTFYAIIGTQFFSGTLKNRCFNEATGKIMSEVILCGNKSCPKGYFCSKSLQNPKQNTMSFDSFGISFLQVVQVLTLNNWTNIMYSVQRAYSSYSWIYFFSLVIIGSFLFLNIVIAVLKVKYTETSLKGEVNSKKRRFFSLKLLRDANFQTGSGITAMEKSYATFNSKKTLQLDPSSPKKNPKRFSIFNDFFMFDKNPFNDKVRRGSTLSVRKMKNSTFNSIIEKENKLIMKKYQQDKLVEKFFGLLNNVSQLFNVFKAAKPTTASLEEILTKRFLEVIVRHDLDYPAYSLHDVLPSIKQKKIAKMMKIQKKQLKRSKLEVKYELELGKVKKMMPILETLHMLTKKANEKEISDTQSSTSLKKKRRKFASLTHNIILKKVDTIKSEAPDRRQKIKKGKRKSQSLMLNTILNFSPLGNHPSARLLRKNAQVEEKNSKKKILKKHFPPKLILDYDTIKERINDDIAVSDIEIEMMDYEEAYLLIREKDLKDKVINKNIWSGVETVAVNPSKLRSILENLIKGSFKKYKQNIVQKIQLNCRRIIDSNFFSLILVICISSNIICLSLEGIIEFEKVDILYKLIAAFYIFEIIIKFFAFSIREQLVNNLYVIDLLVVIYTCIDIYFFDFLKIFISIIPSLRLLRCVIVFRSLRLFKEIEYMNFILLVFEKSTKPFINVALLLFIFILSTTLISMQVYPADFNLIKAFQEEKDFATLSTSLMTVFDILTLDNWDSLVIEGFRSRLETSSLVLAFSIIFFGNFILLNLFTAVLLNGFESASKGEVKDTLNISGEEERKESKEQDIHDLLEKEDRQESTLQKELDVDDRENQDNQNINIINWLREHNNQSIVNNDFEYFKSIFQGKKAPNYKSLFFILKRLSIAITKHRYFDRLIYAVIIITTALLAIDTFIDWSVDSDQEDLKTCSKIMRYLVNTVFFFEACVKIMAMGFIFNQNSYFRSWTNIIDFVSLGSFVLDILIGDYNRFPTLRAVVLARLWRPISFVFKKESISILANAFLQSIKGILNVLVAVLLVWFIFSVVGVTIFKDRFGYCESPINFKISKADCEKGEKPWVNNPRNFDNILSSMFVVFELSTFDNWSSTLSVAVNSNMPSEGPKRFNNQFSSYGFFVSFFIIGVWLFLNLFIGVLFSNFMSAGEKARHAYLNGEQIRWIELQNLMLNAEPAPKNYITSKLKLRLLRLYKSKPSKFLKNGMVVLNLIMLAWYSDEENQVPFERTRITMIILALFYSLWALIKIFVIPIRNLLKKKSNVINFLVAILYSLVVLFDNIFYTDYLIKPAYISTLEKFMKVSAIVLMLKKAQALKNLVRTLYFSVPLLLDISLILALIFFIFAVIGCLLFEEVRTGVMVDEMINFQNLFYGMMTLFKCSTKEDWTQIMWDSSKVEPDCKRNINCGSRFSYLYFLTFMVLISFILMNIFTLIIIQHFEEHQKGSYFILFSFNANFEKYQSVWKNSPFVKKNMINMKNVINFMKSVGTPLGFSPTETMGTIGPRLINMDVKCDKQGNIHFNELFYSLLKRLHHEQLFLNSCEEALQTLFENEKMFYYNLEVKKLMKEKKIKKFEKKHLNLISFDKYEIYSPLSNYFYGLLLLKSWKNFTLRNRKHINEGQHPILETEEVPLTPEKRSHFAFKKVKTIFKHSKSKLLDS